MLVDADQPTPDFPQAVVRDPDTECLVQPEGLFSDPIKAQTCGDDKDCANEQPFALYSLNARGGVMLAMGERCIHILIMTRTTLELNCYDFP